MSEYTGPAIEVTNQISNTPTGMDLVLKIFLIMVCIVIGGVIIWWVIRSFIPQRQIIRKYQDDEDDEPKKKCDECFRKSESVSRTVMMILHPAMRTGNRPVTSNGKLTVYKGNLCEKCINGKINTYHDFMGLDIELKEFKR